MDDLDEGAEEAVSRAKASGPLKRFRLGRYALMLLFAAMAAGFLASAVTSLIIAVDASGAAQVSLKRMTEGGSPAGGPFVSYGTFLLNTALGVCLEVAAAVAAFFLLGDQVRPKAWTALTVVGVLGVGGALIALSLGTGEIQPYLASIAVCYAVLVAAGLFELWRAHWVRRQPDAPASVAPGPAEPAPAEPRPV
jgi:hypothetical protein